MPVKMFWQFLFVLPFLWLIRGDIQLNLVLTMPLINWVYILLFTFVVTLGGYGFMYLSARKVGATKTATLDFLEPLIGVILAILIFGESFGIVQVIGWVLIMFSIVNIKRISYLGS